MSYSADGTSQGMPPEESIMISAFDNLVGGRTQSDGVWHVVAEKHHNQRSPLCETPPRPVHKGEDFAPKGTPQRKAASIPPTPTALGSKVLLQSSCHLALVYLLQPRPFYLMIYQAVMFKETN